MLKISTESEQYRFRELFNGFPTVNEASLHIRLSDVSVDRFEPNMSYCDKYYGRFFTGEFLNKVDCVYGDSRTNYYYHGAKISLPIINEFRVPYRRIPVYKATDIGEIKEAVKSIELANPDYKILLRGQNEVYTIERTDGEREYLYGNAEVVEPSFMPSLTRKELDEGTLTSMWHNFADILLCRLSEKGVNVPDYIRSTEAFNLFALGIAQHYGLPSIGLDLTDDIFTAMWFAIYRATYRPDTRVKADLIAPDHKNANIFVFRCPRLTIFSYDGLWVNIGDERPRRQRAYFNYCGWGLAQNQLALNLAAVFSVDASFARYMPEDFTNHLFPSIDEDAVLREALDIRAQFKGSYFGEILQNIYL